MIVVNDKSFRQLKVTVVPTSLRRIKGHVTHNCHPRFSVCNYSSKRRRNIPSKTNHHIPTRGPTRLNAHVQSIRTAASSDPKKKNRGASRPGKSQQIGRQLSDEFEDLTPPLNTETKMRSLSHPPTSFMFTQF